MADMYLAGRFAVKIESVCGLWEPELLFIKALLNQWRRDPRSFAFRCTEEKVREKLLVTKTTDGVIRLWVGEPDSLSFYDCDSLGGQGILIDIRPYYCGSDQVMQRREQLIIATVWKQIASLLQEEEYEVYDGIAPLSSSKVRK